MATAGRKRLPTEVKKLKGTLQPCRTNVNEPKNLARLGDAPAYMTDAARQAWDYAIQNSPDGLLSSLDGAVLERWANCSAMYREAVSQINRLGVKAMLNQTPSGIVRRSPIMDIIADLGKEMASYEAEMGFTPASRSRVSVKQKEDDGNPFASL